MEQILLVECVEWRVGCHQYSTVYLHSSNKYHAGLPQRKLQQKLECDKWCIDSHNYSSQHCTFRLVHGMFTSENTICYPPSSRMRILAYRKPLHVQCLQNADIGISDVQLLLECGDWLVGRHQVTETQQQNINYQYSDC